MSLNSSPLDGASLGASPSDTQRSFVLTGFDAAETPRLRPLAVGFRLGGPDATLPTKGLFFWDSSKDCTLEPLLANNSDNVFDSIRDDGDCNRLQFIRDNCICVQTVQNNNHGVG